MAAFESDWVFLREAQPLLRDYVLSKDVFWPVRQPAGLQVPQLTIGNVRLSLLRLSALALEGKAKTELADLDQRVRQVRDEWRTNWGNKAAKEHESRLNLWGQIVHQLAADPRGHAASYANAVRQRAVLRLLVDEVNGSVPEDQRNTLSLLDQALRGSSRPGPFAWEPEVQSGFPPDEFWFLYVTV